MHVPHSVNAYGSDGCVAPARNTAKKLAKLKSGVKIPDAVPARAERTFRHFQNGPARCASPAEADADAGGVHPPPSARTRPTVAMASAWRL